MGLDIDPDCEVSELGAGPRQLLEIARCMGRSAQVVVMDEPNSRLSAGESEELFAAIKQLREDGIAVVYISHRLDDLKRVADRVTVLRDGRVVGVFPMATLTQAQLVEHMLGVGRSNEGMELARLAFGRGEAIKPEGPPVLEVRDPSAPPHFRGVSLALHANEVLGLYGLLDAGQREVGRSLVGLIRGVSGRVAVAGREVDCRSSVAARRAGIEFLSDDRRGEGVIGPLSVTRNIVISTLSELTRLGLVRQQLTERIGSEAVRQFDIRPVRTRSLVENMSGGNQQKVLLARALQAGPKVLVSAEPTQGIDVGAKREIHKSLRELASHGVPSLVISSDLPDVVRLCDRVAVMRRGEIAGIVETSVESADGDILSLSVGGVG